MSIEQIPGCCCGCCPPCCDSCSDRPPMYIKIEFFGTISANGAYGGTACSDCDDVWSNVPNAVWTGCNKTIDDEQDTANCESQKSPGCNWRVDWGDGGDEDCGYPDHHWLILYFGNLDKEGIDPCADCDDSFPFNQYHLASLPESSDNICGGTTIQTLSLTDYCCNGCCFNGYWQFTFFD